MFDCLRTSLSRDQQPRQVYENRYLRSEIPGLRELFSEFGGSSFCDGLYRVISPSDVEDWNARICLGFPEFESRITCFAFDWLGSTFAVDVDRMEDGEPGVVMFEPGTGEGLEIPANLMTFHDHDLHEFGEAALAISFYKRWRANGGVAPAFDQCIGYKKPLFLGGKDHVDNLEVSDLDVYWHLMGQLIAKTKGMQPGTPIDII